MPKRLERSIENAVCTYARGKGVEVVKLQGMGKRSLPDRMFLGRKGGVLFIEFKREGLQPTELQCALHARWMKLGHWVHVVDNVKYGKKMIDTLCRLDLEHP